MWYSVPVDGATTRLRILGALSLPLDFLNLLLMILRTTGQSRQMALDLEPGPFRSVKRENECMKTLIQLVGMIVAASPAVACGRTPSPTSVPTEQSPPESMPTVEPAPGTTSFDLANIL